jgi:hypothetical protein
MGYPVGGASVGCIPDKESWDYVLFLSGCYNGHAPSGMWYPSGVTFTWSGISNGFTDSLTGVEAHYPTASVQPFDITKMWYGGQGAVYASGTPYTGQIYATPNYFTSIYTNHGGPSVLGSSTFTEINNPWYIPY